MSLSYLRPRTVGEILDGAFVLYRRHFAVLVAAVLIPKLPVAVYWGSVAANGVALHSAMLAVSLYDLMAKLLFWAALIHLCAAAVQGEAVSLGSAYRYAHDRYLRLIGLAILAGMATATATLLLIIPGIAVYVLLFLAPQAMMIEDLRVTESLDRSWALTKPEWRRAAGVLAVTGVIFFLPFTIVAAVEGLVEGEAVRMAGVSGILQTLLHVLVYPFAAASGTLLYYDCRVRAEALDLELAAERLAPA